MQLKRGTAPTTVEREIDIEITRAEVIAILGAYAKRKFGTDKLRFDDIQVVADKDASNNMVFPEQPYWASKFSPWNTPKVTRR
jgi:hypothetical protein